MWRRALAAAAALRRARPSRTSSNPSSIRTIRHYHATLPAPNPRRRLFPPPPPASQTLPPEWVQSESTRRMEETFATLRSSTSSDLGARHQALAQMLADYHAKGLHFEVLRTFRELFDLKYEKHPQPQAPIRPAEAAFALSAAVASNQLLALEQALLGFFDSYPHDEETGQCLIADALGKDWWTPIAAGVTGADGWKALWALYQQAKQRHVPTVGLFSHVLDALTEAAARQGEKAKQRKTLSATSSTQDILLSMLSPVAPQAFLLLERMSDEVDQSSSSSRGSKPITPEDVHEPVFLLLRAGLVDESYALLRRLTEQGLTPLQETYEGLVRGFCRQGRQERAMNLLREMQEKGCLPAGIGPSVDDWSAHLATLGNSDGAPSDPGGGAAGEWDSLHSLELLNTLTETYGLAPSIGSYGRIMKGLAQRGRGLEAFNLLETIKAQGMVPDVWCYNYALMACGRCRGMRREAAELFAEMPEEDKSAFTYSLAIHAATKEGHWQQARALLDEMHGKTGFKPSIGCYIAAMNAYARAGRAEEALALLKRMQAEGVTLNAVVYTVAIDACARRAMVDEALELLREMEEEWCLPPSSLAYGSAIHACAKAQQGGRALGLLRKMQEKGLEVTEVHYGAAMNALNQSEGDDAALLGLYEEVKAKGLPLVVGMFAAAINAAAYLAGAYAQAVDIGRDLLAYGHAPNARALKLLMNSAEKARRYADGVLFFKAALAHGVDPDVYPVSNRLALSCAGKIGDVETLLVCLKRAKPVEDWMLRSVFTTLNSLDAAAANGGKAEGEGKAAAIKELKVLADRLRREAGERYRQQKRAG